MPQLRLRIMPMQMSLVVDIDQTTTIKELFEYLQSEYQELQQQNNSQTQTPWQCLVVRENKYLSLIEKIPSYPCELLIDTKPNIQQTQKLQSNQQIQQIQNQQQILSQKQQESPTQQQFSQAQQIQEENINLLIAIQDGNTQRNLNIKFSSNQLLENVAQAVLIFCGLNEQVAAVDLELFNNQYNKPEKRNKSLGQLQIRTNTQLTARIRWIGG